MRRKRLTSKIHRFCQQLIKIVLRTIFIICMVLVMFVIFFSFNDFPDRLVRRVLSVPNKSSFFFDVERVRLNFFSGIIIKNIYVYRKEKPGDAGVHIKTLIVDINWFDLMQKHMRIRKMKFLNTTIQSRQLIVPAENAERRSLPVFNLNVEGSVFFKDLYLDGVWFQEISADAKCRGSQLYVNHINGVLGNLEHPGSFSNATMVYDSEKAQVDVTLITSLNPYFLVPLLTRWGNSTLVKFIQRFDKETLYNTRFDGSINRKFNTDDSMLIEGLFEVMGSKYNGVPFLNAETELSIYTSKNGAKITGEKCYIVKNKGIAHGNFTTEGEFDNIKFKGTSTIALTELMQLMNIQNRFVQRIKFDTHPAIQANGVVCPKNYTNNQFYANIESSGFTYSNFHFSTFNSDIVVEGITNTLKNFKSDFYGGDMEGNLTFVILDNSYTNIDYYGNFSLDSVNYGLFAPALGMQNSEEVSGLVDCNVELDGKLTENIWKGMNAKGSFSIKHGWLFRMHFFGGLSKILAHVIPGLDFIMSQSDLRVNFDMKDGIADITKFSLDGDVLSISGKGKVNLINKEFDMKFQIKFMKQHTLVAKLVNTVVWPLSKLFEVRLTGTIENPNWQAVNF